MKKSSFLYLVVMAMLIAPNLSAQDSPSDETIDERLRALETQVEQLRKQGPTPELDEIRRQIEILAQEIETLRLREKDQARPDQTQHGLGAAASKVYRSAPGVSFGGYGEALYENFDSSRENGTASGKTDQFDLLRAVLYTGYKFNDRMLFNSELEVEHSTTKDGVGEVSMEFAYLDFMQRPELGWRAGLVLVPVGFINELHEPTAFLGAKRPDVERVILPATWREAGLGIFGEKGSFSWRGYLVTGLDSEDFSASGIRNGRQGGAKAKAEDFALVGRLDWQPREGILVGGSIYSGDSAQGRTTPSGQSFAARVTIAELHTEARIRGLSLRGLFADGSLGDAAAVNQANGLTGSKSVGDEFKGWYLEGGYDLGSIWSGRSLSVTPFARYEKFDTQASVPRGFLKNPALDTILLTLGVAWKPDPQIVIKAECQQYSNEADTGVDQVNVAIGYVF